MLHKFVFARRQLPANPCRQLKIGTIPAKVLVGAEGRFAVHSADPSKARVIFRMHDSDKAKAQSLRQGRGEWKPEGIAFHFAGESRLNGVVFDNVLEGGIAAPASVRKTWKNISYGENNLAEPEKLHRTMAESK